MLCGVGARGQLSFYRRLGEHVGIGHQGVDVVDAVVEIILDGIEIAVVGIADLAGDDAARDLVDVIGGDVERRNHGVQHGIDAADNVGIRAAELVGLAALGELSFLRSMGQTRQFFLQVLQNGADVVDRLLHLLVIALIGVCDQLVDLAAGDLRENPVAFADRQQNRVQHAR